MNQHEFAVWLVGAYPSASPHQIAQFEQYRQLIEKWNEAINLVSRADGLDLYEKHFTDSLLFALPPKASHGVVLDLGSGAGFPGIPLKIMHPELTIYLLEPTKKRSKFLERVVSDLLLSRVTIVNERAEVYAASYRETFDLVLARAVAPLNILLELAAPLVKPQGYIMAYKGVQAASELATTATAQRVLDLTLAEHRTTLLPHAGHERHLLVFRKEAATARRYPRSYADIKHKPL